MNSKNKMLSGIGWTYAERLLAQVVSFLVSIVLARLVSPQAFGLIAIVQVFITICDALTIGGFGNALIQTRKVSNEDFCSICWFSVGISVLLYFLLFFSAPYVQSFYDMAGLCWVMRVMGLRIIISAYNSIQQAFIQRKMEFKKFFFSTLGGTLFSAIVGLTMAYKGFGVWALVAQYMTNSIVDTMVLYFTIEWKPQLIFSLKSIKKLWKFGFGILLSTLTYTLKDSIRSIIIGKKYSADSLAYYNQGKKYPNLVMSDIVDSLGKVLFPFLSEKQENRSEIKNYMRKSVRATSFLLCPILAGIVAVADTFVYAFLTAKWADSIIYMRILTLVYIARPLCTVFQKSILAIGKSSINLCHEIITSLLTIVLILIAIFYFNSIPPIAWSYVIVTIIGTVFFAFFVKKYFNYSFKEMLIDYAPSFLLSCFMAICVFFMGRIQINIWIKLIIQIIAGVTIYLGLAVLFRFDVMNILIKKISRRNEK